jgi:MinD-like ATPase involved in chromosome partitioning or flagellar assembly
MREDQAAGLRRLFTRRAARVLLVADSAWPRRGWLALNLAAAFARAGEQVMVLDAERESVGTLWGARCRCELGHVLDGDRRLVEVMVPGPGSSVILPMRRAGATLARQGCAGQRLLARALEGFMEHDGLLVVPLAPARLASALWRFGGGDLLYCIGSGTTAATGAYASIKSLLAHRPQPSVQVALASTDTAQAAQVRFGHLDQIVKRFLGVTLGFAGGVPGADLAQGLGGRTLYDDAPAAARSIEALARAVAEWNLPQLEFTVRREPRHSRDLVSG